MPAGVFITLEGVEGSGKTTQAAILGDALRKSGRNVTVTHEPGGTRAGETIRVAAELLLVLADRAQHVREKLRPALASGEIVISDRYSDSTTAYQGYARGVDLKVLGELNRLATDNVTPALTIVLDLPVETGLERTRARAKGTGRGSDRFEGERAEFHRKVRDGFLAIAKAEPSRVIVIDADRPVAAVTADIRLAVDELLARQ
jgi:dTMP kinase